MSFKSVTEHYIGDIVCITLYWDVLCVLYMWISGLLTLTSQFGENNFQLGRAAIMD